MVVGNGGCCVISRFDRVFINAFVSGSRSLVMLWSGRLFLRMLFVPSLFVLYPMYESIGLDPNWVPCA